MDVIEQKITEIKDRLKNANTNLSTEDCYDNLRILRELKNTKRKELLEFLNTNKDKIRYINEDIKIFNIEPSKYIFEYDKFNLDIIKRNYHNNIIIEKYDLINKIISFDDGKSYDEHVDNRTIRNLNIRLQQLFNNNISNINYLLNKYVDNFATNKLQDIYNSPVIEINKEIPITNDFIFSLNFNNTENTIKAILNLTEEYTSDKLIYLHENNDFLFFIKYNNTKKIYHIAVFTPNYIKLTKKEFKSFKELLNNNISHQIFSTEKKQYLDAFYEKLNNEPNSNDLLNKYVNNLYDKFIETKKLYDNTDFIYTVDEIYDKFYFKLDNLSKLKLVTIQNKIIYKTILLPEYLFYVQKIKEIYYIIAFIPDFIAIYKNYDKFDYYIQNSLSEKLDFSLDSDHVVDDDSVHDSIVDEYNSSSDHSSIIGDDSIADNHNSSDHDGIVDDHSSDHGSIVDDHDSIVDDNGGVVESKGNDDDNYKLRRQAEDIKKLTELILLLDSGR